MPVDRFGGLDLRDDPQEVGLGSAIDGLNVDVSTPGRLSARDGYALLTAAPADASYSSMVPYYRTSSSTKQLIAMKGASASANSAVQVLSTAGAVTATQVAVNFPHAALLRFGKPLQDLVLAFTFRMTSGAPDPSAGFNYWDGSTWTAATIAGLYGANAAAVQKTSNRVIASFVPTIGQSPQLAFSNAGNPLTYNDFLDITPGDGEYIVNLTSYRELVFAFKQTKFFVFYGNETSSTGTLVPNYRSVDAGVGCVCHRGAVAAPEGVYFLDRTGVYLTTGSTPSKVSGPLDPLFGKGALPSYYLGSAINWASIEWASLDYYNGRLLLSVPTGASTTNDTTFVLDVASGQWMPWDTKINGATSFRIGNQEEMVYSLSSGTNDIVRKGQPFTYTLDGASAISARFRTGFWNPGAPAAESWLRESILDGTGAVSLKRASNDAVALSSAQTVTLGTSPAVGVGRDRRGLRGRNVSHEISGTAPWSVSRMEHLLWGQRVPGEQA